jgi:hypothetical protein
MYKSILPYVGQKIDLWLVKTKTSVSVQSYTLQFVQSKQQLQNQTQYN